MIFPVASGQAWNGNAYNSLGEQDYQYGNVNVPYSVNGLNFDSTATVLQDDIVPDSNLVQVRIEEEMFAKHVGLIYKRYRNVGKLPDPAYPDSVLGGVDYTYKIISFGN